MATRGGKREGAGRPKMQPVLNPPAAYNPRVDRQSIKELVALYPDRDPLRVLVGFAGDPKLPPNLRIAAAAAAAPFIYPKLSAVAVSRDNAPPSEANVERLRAQLLRAMSQPMLDDTPPQQQAPLTPQEPVEPAPAAGGGKSCRSEEANRNASLLAKIDEGCRGEIHFHREDDSRCFLTAPTPLTVPRSFPFTMC
jgi:hypothetical protein